MYETHDKRALLLPNATSADAGKVLAVDENGKLSLEEIESELPALTGNAGKVLTVASGASGVEWKDVPSEVPSLTGNAGKVLKVDADAEGVEWGEAGGGSGLTLYGPYYATQAESKTINAGGIGTIPLPSIFMEDDTEVTYPDTEGKCFVAAVSGVSCALVSFSAPLYYNGEWDKGSMTVINTTEQSVTIGALPVNLSFYSTVEFPALA